MCVLDEENGDVYLCVINYHRAEEKVPLTLQPSSMKTNIRLVTCETNAHTHTHTPTQTLLDSQYLVLIYLPASPLACLLACLFVVHGKICLRTRKSSAFLLSRFIFLTYLLGIIHILHTLIYVQIYRCCLVFRWYCWCVCHPQPYPATYVRDTHRHAYQWNAHRSFAWKVECPYCYFLLAISRRSLSFMSWFTNHPQFHYLQIIFNRIRRHRRTYSINCVRYMRVLHVRVLR